MTRDAALPQVAELIRSLGLLPHPEGGYYRETYRATRLVDGGRAASTMIYFLLPAGQVSRLHRIDADEGWHHYLGGTLEIHELDESDAVAPSRVTRLGANLAAGEVPQHLVPAGRWFGAVPAPGVPFALVGCTVAPGFEFARFQLGERADLLARFPAAAGLVARLT
jgi:uncharacterized protein